MHECTLVRSYLRMIMYMYACNTKYMTDKTHTKTFEGRSTENKLILEYSQIFKLIFV